MKRRIITVAMLMVSMSYSFASTSDLKGDSTLNVSQIKVLNSDKASVYNLFYQAPSKGYVDLNIYDPDGKKVHSSYRRFENDLSLKQSFDLGNMPFGIYKFEVVNKGGKIIEMVNHQDVPVKMEVKLALISDKGKYSLNVFRDSQKPVFVNIYDKEQNIIYEDKIEIDSNFSRIYDLSKIPSKEVSFEVSCGGSKYLAKIE